jgi:Fe-S-cluster-containing dehydrogenase component
VKHVQYDSWSVSGMLDAYGAATGDRRIPLHDFSKAKTIVSIGADFLGNWPNAPLAQKQFAATRKLGDDKKDMSRLYAFESNLSLTGANADYRSAIKPSEEAAYVAGLYNLLSGGSANVGDKVTLEKAAKDLMNSRGAALVVSGSNDANVQALVIAINDLLGSYGTTIDLGRRFNTRQGNDKAMGEFISGVKSGAVDGVIFYNCNPVYDHPMGEELGKSLDKLKISVSTSDRNDETTSVVKYVAPDCHYLESWNDFETVTGHFSLSQPTITNIFNTRQAQDSFLVWAGVETAYYDFLKSNWSSRGNWDKNLHDGVLMTDASNGGSVSVDAGSALASVSSKGAGSGLELVLYQNSSIGDGRQANNPWLQEMPDPITKGCWDNYITMSPKQAKELGLYNASQQDKMEVYKVNLTVNGKTVEVPVMPQPGQAYGTIGLAVGYGRTKAGKVADNVGVNAYQFISLSGTSKVEVSGATGMYQVAQTQTSQTFMGRENVIQEALLSEYKENAQAGRFGMKITKGKDHVHPYAVSLWKGHEYPNHHWGMMVDLNSCNGCGACTIACQSENNIAVVGKREVLNRREMHWIRIDRYYSTDAPKGKQKEMEIAAEKPEVTFQPMMCQQCNSAPCETVCPVAATTHSSEGLNQMAYNRCIGTRYCANNCPYKVRRFNWFKYHDNEQFGNNTAMNNDLGKMVLNPDVTVRSRGVMEKCSFCVQRIQAGKLAAKKDGRRPEDGEINTACAAACSAGALVFGDMKDPDSRIAKMLKIEEGEKSVTAKEPRAYHVLEELRVMPNVWYLTKIRNKDKQDKSQA